MTRSECCDGTMKALAGIKNQTTIELIYRLCTLMARYPDREYNDLLGGMVSLFQYLYTHNEAQNSST